MKKLIGLFIASFIISLVFFCNILPSVKFKNVKEIITEIIKPKYNYYESKKATIDPVMVKELIDSKEKDYAIVDIRSAMEFKWSHIKGAINMPAYEDPNNVYQTQTKLDDVFKNATKKITGKKLVIVYSYRPDVDITDKAVEYLKKYNLPVRILSITWYDWLHNFATWMPGIQVGGFDNSRYVESVNNSSSVQIVPMMPIAPNVPAIPQ